MLNHPVLVFFPVSLIVMWLAARIGLYFRGLRPLNEEDREEFGFVQAATLTLFLLNRHLTEPLTLELTARGFAGLTVAHAHQLCDADLDALNSRDSPDRIKPGPMNDIAVGDSELRATLQPASWNVVSLHRS